MGGAQKMYMVYVNEKMNGRWFYTSKKSPKRLKFEAKTAKYVGPG